METYSQLREELQSKVFHNPYLEKYLGEELFKKALSYDDIPIQKIKKLNMQCDKLIKRYKPEEEERLRKIKEQQKTDQLKYMQNEFAKKLDQYKKMYSVHDLKPDFSEFEYYKNIPPDPLQDLMDTLNQRIDHQALINALKERYRKGAKYYADDEDNNNIKKCQLNEIIPDYSKTGRNYRKELKRLCKLYLQNSKIIEDPINSFHHIMKNYFDRAKNNIEEIFELKESLPFYISEKIPYVGIFPKSIRFIDEVNLTRCILQDFEEITYNYIQHGIQPVMNKYGEQYNTIVDFTKKANYSKLDIKYTQILLKIIQNAKAARVKTYAKLYENFVKGGQAIKNICNNVKIKDGTSLAVKTIKLLTLLLA